MKLRYVELETNRIFNKLAPENVTAWYWLPEQYRDKWWDDDIIKMRRYFGQVWTEEFNKITQHFSNLEESVKQHGILRPISIVCGTEKTKYIRMFPPKYQHNQTTCLYTFPFGGSRVTTAVKLGINTIPCVIHDKYDLFSDAPEVNQNNYKKWFSDEYLFTSELPYIRIKRHLHLDSKFDKHGQHSKMAQRDAARIARKEVLKKYG